MAAVLGLRICDFTQTTWIGIYWVDENNFFFSNMIKNSDISFIHLTRGRLERKEGKEKERKWPLA